MIQCPLCQMINEDQTRFCAECGARLGPSPNPGPGGPPAQQGMPPQAPHQGQPTPPQGGPGPGPRLNSPMLSNAGNEGPAPGGFGQPQGNDPGEMDRLRRMSNRPPQDQQQHTADPRNEQAAAPPAKPAKRLRSPLLESEDDDYPEDYPPQQPQGGGRGLRSPMLGAGNAPQDRGHAPDQGGHNSPSGRHHLHSPLLGGGDDDYYEDQGPAPARPGGLHSPMLGGGGGAARPGGLRSPMLGAAAQGSGGFEDYEDDDDYDPYADEGNPNILRSPLLSSKINEEQHGRAARQQPRDPNYPPSPQSQQGRPTPQPTPPQGAFQSPQGQDPRAWDNSGSYGAPQGQQMPPNPGPAPQMPHAPQMQAPSNPQMQAPQMQTGSQPPATDSFGETRPRGGEEFPDMTQYRRRDGQPSPNDMGGGGAAIPPTMQSAQAPISQFSGSLDAGFIPPDPNETMAGTPPAAPQTSSYNPTPPAATTPPAARKMDAPEKQEPPAKPPKRSSSKLLGDSDADEDFDAGFPPGQRGSSHHKQFAPAPQQGPGSPIPKMLGGVAILMALVKVTSLLPLIQAMTDPRYPPAQIQQFQSMALDLATTMIAIIAVGLGLLMSKN